LRRKRGVIALGILVLSIACYGTLCVSSANRTIHNRAEKRIPCKDGDTDKDALCKDGDTEEDALHTDDATRDALNKAFPI
jgi:hypothetical protein